MQLPEYVKNLIEILHAEGEEAYAVGGCVRDMIMGREPNDYDMTTSAPPERTKEIFEGAGFRVIPTGLKHGTITVISDSHHVEITTFRIDGDYNDSRHPDSVTFTRRVEDDLARRDFTVNAMAYNEKDGLVDVFGGKADINKKIIRAVGDPEKRFSEDALRILRAVRFSATLGFEIDPATISAMESTKDGLLRVSRERICVEFWKILVCERAQYGLDIMLKTGIFGVVFPRLDAQIKNALCFDKIDTLPRSFEIRMAYILSYSNEDARTEALKGLKLPSACEKKIKILHSSLDATIPDGKSASEVRRFIKDFGECAEEAVLLRAALDAADFSSAVEAIAAERAKSPCLTLAQLKLSGKDVIALGVTDGRAVGEILASLLDGVIDDPALNDKETLTALALDILKGFNPPEE